ncbi:hypothetical protein K438DRAFT_1945260 [Mycena galopus ATCC 62051]|nr:hypothetical protein K438DRAFT_1945260 [Mycena galopus ATCC 62051]
MSRVAIDANSCTAQMPRWRNGSPEPAEVVPASGLRTSQSQKRTYGVSSYSFERLTSDGGGGEEMDKSNTPFQGVGDSAPEKENAPPAPVEPRAGRMGGLRLRARGPAALAAREQRLRFSLSPTRIARGDARAAGARLGVLPLEEETSLRPTSGRSARHTDAEGSTLSARAVAAWWAGVEEGVRRVSCVVPKFRVSPDCGDCVRVVHRKARSYTLLPLSAVSPVLGIFPGSYTSSAYTPEDDIHQPAFLFAPRPTINSSVDVSFRAALIDKCKILRNCTLVIAYLPPSLLSMPFGHRVTAAPHPSSLASLRLNQNSDAFNLKLVPPKVFSSESSNSEAGAGARSKLAVSKARLFFNGVSGDGTL